MERSLRIKPHKGAPIEWSEETRVLQAEADYLIEGPREHLDVVAAGLPGSVVEDLGQVLRLRFGNAVGALDLPFLGRVEVRSGKWDEGDFERMLAQVAERAAALPFAAGSATGIPYDRSLSADRAVLYHVFVYLRHALSEHAPPSKQLLPALRAILSDPHRLFRRERRWVDLALATRVDARTLEGIVAGLGGAMVGGGTAGIARAAFGGVLPESVDEACVRPTVDVPENRFVRAFLGQITGVIDEMEAHVAPEDGLLPSRIRAQCIEMRRSLLPILRHPLWSEVGDMRRLPAESTVLQRRFGYREVLGHFVRMRLSSAPLPPRVVEQLLELKDIATLYEVWCFFQVERCMTEVLGPPQSADSPRTGKLAMKAQHDLRIRWPRGIELFYNRTFVRGEQRRHSYSVQLRPDVALRIRDREYHFFDAKFRLHWKALDEGDVKDTRHADLHKMHAYRDAIAEGASSWVLYPGDVFRFYGVEGDAIDHPDGVPLPPRGIGAIPCSPGAESRELLRVLEAVLSG